MISFIFPFYFEEIHKQFQQNLNCIFSFRTNNEKILSDSTALKLQSNVLKQNLIQLQNCTVARKKEGISEEQISEYLLLKPSKENIFKIQQQLNKIKSQIYDVLDSPIDECYIINSVYIITLISFLSIFNFNWIFASPFNLNYLKNIFWLILIYFGPLIHVLFYKSFYKQAFSRGSTFFLPASLLGLLVLFFWRNQLFYFNKIKYLKTKKTENQNEHDDSFTTFSTTSPPSLSDTVNMDYTNTFANFSTNILLFAQIITWIELAATLVFGKLNFLYYIFFLNLPCCIITYLFSLQHFFIIFF